MTKNQPVKTIFAGSSFEGLEALNRLHKHKVFDVKGVITQPDRPVGRKRDMTPTVIKKAASKLNIPVFHPAGIPEKYMEIAEELKPDLVVVIAYGNMLPQEFLEFPKFKCINVHYSLLPKLRGAIPVQAAILRDFKKTGVTIQIMAEGLDEGPILSQKEIGISTNETTPSLKSKLIPAGDNLLIETLENWAVSDSEIEIQEQNHSEATYCSKEELAKDNAQINWKRHGAERIERMIRAMIPWPVVWTKTPDGKRLKIFKAEIKEIPKYKGLKAGKLLKYQNMPFFATKIKSTFIKLLEVQPAGKTKMSGEEFARGLKV